MPYSFEPITPHLIHYFAHAKNGNYPDSSFYSKLVEAENFLTAFRHKEVFRKSVALGVGGGGSANTLGWRFRFRSSYGAKALRVIAVLGAQHADMIEDEPFINIELTESGGSPDELALHYGNPDSSADDPPESWSVQSGTFTINPASIYTGYITAENAARIIAISIYEEGETVLTESTSYYNTEAPVAGGAILDDRIERVIVGLSNMLRQNGGLTFNWCLVDGAARTRSSATYINLIDDTTTGTPTTTAHGFSFDTTARNTYSRVTVPIELAVYASIPSGTGNVRLIRTDGTVAVTVPVNSSTPQWFVVSGSIAVGVGLHYALQYAGSGTQTISVYAVSGYEYEA